MQKAWARLSASTVMMYLVQKLTKKKALGTGPACALQAEYALDDNVLITMLKVSPASLHVSAIHVSAIHPA